MAASNQYWIGLHFDSSSGKDSNNAEAWAWVDGSPYSWMNWQDGEPDSSDSHARMILTGEWKGIRGSFKVRYICEQGM